MSGKDGDYRIFVGGLSWDVTERQLEDAFSRYGKIIDSQIYIKQVRGSVWNQIHFVRMVICRTADAAQIMLERDTGRPRGFGFLTFADHRSMDDAIREMHGRELGSRMISVNKAQPKMSGEDSDRYGGGYSSGGRGSYGGGGGDRSAGPDNCFRCGRPGHWARDCPSEGGGRGARPVTPPRSRYAGGGGRGDRYGSERDRYVEDRYDRGHYADRERYDSRDDRYGGRDRYANDRYPAGADRFAGNKYGGPDRNNSQNGYGKERGFDRDGGPRGGDRYGAGGGPTRYEGKSYRDRSGPYDRPPTRGRAPSFDRY